MTNVHNKRRSERLTGHVLLLRILIAVCVPPLGSTTVLLLGRLAVSKQTSAC